MASDNAYYRLAFRIFADFGITIAVPAVLGALAGQWLDNRYQTVPMYTIILLIVAFALTGYIIIKKARTYGKEYSILIRTKKKPKPPGATQL